MKVPKVPKEPDAALWATEMVKTMKKHEIDVYDIDFYIGWFANFWSVVQDPLMKRIEYLESKLKDAKELYPEIFV